MISRLLRVPSSCRQWSPGHILYRALVAHASGVSGPRELNATKFQEMSKQPKEDPFERNVKKRVLDIELSLSMPYAGKPSSREISKWRNFLESSSKEPTCNLEGIVSNTDPLPTWALLYLLVTKVHNPSHTPFALDLVNKNLHRIPGRERPYILILLTRIMAKLQVEPPMEDIIYAFLQLPVPTSRTHFNLLLRTMSRFRPSVHLAKLTTIILDTMVARQLRLSRATYTTLLRNRFITLELTKLLQRRMLRDGLRPNAKEFELFLRVFGKDGASHTSSQYVSFVRRLQLEQGKRSPRGVDSAGNDPPVRLLNNPSFSAFEFLRNLIDESTVHTSALREEQKLVEPYVKGRSSKSVGPGHSSWTAALHAAARDWRVSSDGLLLLFERSKKAGLTPTLATYTVLIGGLLKKSGDYTNSLKLWRELRDTIEQLDTVSLTVGMDVLVGSGRALEAFHMLDKYSVGGFGLSRQKGIANRDTPLLNAFMSALQKHGWPTAVFHAWDVMKPLFGVQPDAVTLTLLLRAAHDAERADDSMRGLMGHINELNPFRSGNSSVPPTLSKAEFRQHICACLNNEDAQHLDATNSNPKTMRSSSIWNGRPAGPKALELFRSITLGNYPRLRGAELPAKAVWSDNANDASPLRDVAQGLGLVSQSKTEHVSNNDVNQSTSPHPQIAPDERSFHAYIQLLGAQRCSSDVPLALSWMKELGLVPRKETICLALVLFAEVGLRGPLLETYGGISEYKRLVAWLKKWLGEDKLPTEAGLRRAFINLQRSRGGMFNNDDDS